MKEILPDSAHIEGGRLLIGGCDTTVLARQFGTPLLVFDHSTFEARAKAFADVVGPPGVFYAGKAFLCVALCRLLDDLGLGLDVCAGGEVATARSAGFPAAHAVFHGNNKSAGELRDALEWGIGRVVVDSFDELDRLQDLDARTKLLVRVTPGVEAHTHEFVQTGQEDSKFGFTLAGGVALEGLRRAMKTAHSEVIGVHAHIGSQIFELAAFDLAVRRVADFLEEARRELGFVARELNLGGGLGIAHTRDELTPDPREALGRITQTMEREFLARDLEVPALAVEPGRAIVGAAVATLYEVGTVKRISGVRTYVSVDGGMSDNIRPPLYGARYEAFLANRADASSGPRVTIAGKHCESGDVLIEDVHLPDDVAPGDLLCIPATGAYTYSMANNYNRVPRPAVVMVHEGEAKEIIRRETYEDVLQLDRTLDDES